MSKWQWVLLQMSRRLWVRATLIGALGVAAAIIAALAERFLPWRLPIDIGADAVDSILSIIASSMLAVTTFSLSVMASAYGAAASNVTPRATKLLRQDRLTQNVLSTFIGSFLFSIVGLVTLKTGAYGPQGRGILFAVTVGVIALVVVSLLRWIDYLTRLGNVTETTARVEAAARAAMLARIEHPFLGGRELDTDAREPPPLAAIVRSRVTGYVQYVDVSALQDCGEQLDAELGLAVVPGAFVHVGQPLAWIEAIEGGAGALEGLEDAAARVGAAFSIGSERSFDQDPRFGLAVLSEIAARALSPAVNDPGTAIEVIGRASRLLTLWAGAGDAPAPQPPDCPRVRVPRLTSADLFDDAFRAIARDGATMIEVQLRLQKTLAALRTMGDEDFQAAADEQARLARAHAQEALRLDADRALLRRITEEG